MSFKPNHDIKQSKPYGFTVVELLIVIVVIAILATITIIAYNGINLRAKNTTLISDLKNAANQLGVYNANNASYPTSNDCSSGTSPTPPLICLHSSGLNSFTSYVLDTSIPAHPHYKLIASNGSYSYYVTDLENPTINVSVTVTGGTVTTSGTSTIRTFTSSGTLTVSGGTLTNVSVLVIGGGGGGGQVVGGSGESGGGGGGQFLSLSGQSVAGTKTVTIGAGGAQGVNGNPSSFDTNNASGGGGGGPTNGPGLSGASGGGGGDMGRPGGTGTTGFDGGPGGTGGVCGGTPGGGGGAGGGGFSSGGGSCIGGVGGIGLSSSITGTSVCYAGGGSAEASGYACGGGGTYPLAPGTPNRGGGGAMSMLGGSGVVIISYITP